MSDDSDGVLDGLLGGNSSQWAFGSDFENPLAGIDTTITEGTNAAELAQYCLMLGDDSLVLAHRVSEWCSNAPDIEDDLALANIALDHIGQARLLLSRAAAADPSILPRLPDGSPTPPEDALAFFRDAEQFRNIRLVEVANGDFAHIVVRLLLFTVARFAVLDALRSSSDRVLAAVAAKSVKELAYHRDWAGRWFLALARGTDESLRRLVAALDALWPLKDELLTAHPLERRLARDGAGVDPESVRSQADDVLEQVLAVSGVDRPSHPPLMGIGGRGGRDGLHMESLSRMLAEMQVVARAHPSGNW